VSLRDLRPARLWSVLREAVRGFRDDDTATMGAALAYYSVFSLVPLLVIVAAIGGFFLGADKVNGEIRGQMSGLFGKDTAEQVASMMQGAYSPGEGWWRAGLAVLLLAFGATGAFTQLRSTLNELWDVEPPRRGFVRALLARVFSFAMVVCLAFLLLVSLALQAGVAALVKFAGAWLPESLVFLLGGTELVFSLGVTTLLFAAVYRFMSDARVRWGDVWAGAILTTILFTAGKYALGLYLGTSSVADTYGMAKSVILVLLWVFYSSQIVFFGAEFVSAWAADHGHRIVPRGAAGEPSADEDSDEAYGSAHPA
jgi:membrane protein